jgi:CTP:molybdopterin cytidylyltransferase MocA
LCGDEGARDLVAKYSDKLVLQTTRDAGVLKDIDHPSDLPHNRD